MADTVAPQSTAPQVPGISGPIDTVVSAAPELRNDPGSVVSVASSGGDTAGRSQAFAQGGKRQAHALAADSVQQAGGGWLNDIKHVAGSFVSHVAKAANVGLATVQQEYRYLHDVEAKHGMGAALTEGLFIVGGAAAGTVLDPGEGTLLGAEAVARLEGAVAFKDSWKAAANPNYKDPNTGKLVSFGRDVASFAGLKGGQASDLSGVLDAVGDMVADPVALGGKAFAGAHSINGMGGQLGKVFTGLGVTPEKIEQAYKVMPDFRLFASDAAKSDAGTITAHYPQLAPIAEELGAAKTGVEVKDTLVDLAKADEVLRANQIPSTVIQPKITFAKLPTLTPQHLPFRALRDAARNAGEGPISTSGIPIIAPIAHMIAENKFVGPQTWAKRLERQGGTTLTDNNDLTGSQISQDDTRGAGDIYNTARYGYSDRASRAIVNAYAEASPTQRVTIHRNLIMGVATAMSGMKVPEQELLAHPDLGQYLDVLGKGDIRQMIDDRIRNHVATANFDGQQPGTVYGMYKGQNIPPVINPDSGEEIQAAITENQTRDLSMPNFEEMKAMARALQAARVHKVLANADGFFYDHVTQGFFKPLVLMSAGYGLHITMAELAMNTLRHGLVSSLNGLYDRALANIGYKVEIENKAGFVGWLYNIGGAKLLHNSDDAMALAQVYALMEGHKVTPALSTADNYQAEINPVERANQGFRQEDTKRLTTGSNFVQIGNDSKRFNYLWRAELRENANNRWTQIAAKSYRDALASGKSESEATEMARKDVLQGLQDEPMTKLQSYARAKFPMKGAPDAWSPLDAFAYTNVLKVKGAVHAQGERMGEHGVPHMDLLDSISNGHTPSMDDLDAIPQEGRPEAVKGRETIPDGSSLPQRIANQGFKRLLNPMVNILSRHQEFAIEFVDAQRALRPQVKAGLMSEDEALTRSAAQASTHGARFVHNLHDRTQWTSTLRNWAPFYFAQEQAYRRMGRLLVEDPGAFRRYQMAIVGAHNIASTLSDGNGNNYIGIPASGYLGKGVADAMGMSGLSLGNVSPAQFGGTSSSMNVIFPLSEGVKPDFGPLAVLAASQASSHFAELGQSHPQFRAVANKAASSLAWVAGPQAMDESVLEQLIPNATMLRAAQAAMGDGRSFNSALYQAYQLADYQQAKAEEAWIKGGEKGPEPHLIPKQTDSAMVKQDWQNKMRNMTRALWLANAVSGFFSPISSHVEMQNFGFPKEINDSITKYGSVSQGMTHFIAKNPDATAYTVAQSFVPSNVQSGEASNYHLASSQGAMDWVTKNTDLVHKYGAAAMWLMPQLKDSKYSPTVYNEQIAQGLRQKDTPEQFLNSLYKAAGDQVFYAGLTLHERALDAAGNSTAAKDAQYNAWNQWVATLKKQFPVWSVQHFSDSADTERLATIQDLTHIIDTGQAPPSEHTDNVASLLQYYYQFATDYAEAGSKSNYQHAQKEVQDNWYNYLDQVETTNPELKPFIQSILKRALKVVT